MDNLIENGDKYSLLDFKELITKKGFDNVHDSIAQLSASNGYFTINELGAIELSWDENASTVCKYDDDYTIIEFLTLVENLSEENDINKELEGADMNNNEIGRIVGKFKSFYGENNIVVNGLSDDEDNIGGKIDRTEIIINNKEAVTLEAYVDGEVDVIIDDVEINRDNIHLYYEFMSDDDKIKASSTLLNLLFKERAKEINKVLNTLYSSELSDLKVVDTTYYKTNNTTNPDIYDDGKCLDWGGNFGTLEVSYFGVKDTLNPIDEYIKEIKESDRYKNYVLENAINKEDGYIEINKCGFVLVKNEEKESFFKNFCNGVGDGYNMPIETVYQESLLEGYSLFTSDGFFDEAKIFLKLENPLNKLVENYENSLIKDSSLDEVKQLVEKHNIPTSKLHKQR